MVYKQGSTTVIPVFQKNSQEWKRVKNKEREVQGNIPQWCAEHAYLFPTPPSGTLPVTP